MGQCFYDPSTLLFDKIVCWRRSKCGATEGFFTELGPHKLPRRRSYIGCLHKDREFLATVKHRKLEYFEQHVAGTYLQVFQDHHAGQGQK